jgi:transcriptional regulator with XRE-family HTH domain
MLITGGTVEITELMTDEAVLTELGERISHARLDLQLTQANLAEQAGVAKRTLERIEAGASAQSSSLIRVLRVLDRLPNLDRLVPETGPGPMDLLKRRGKVRKRASSTRQSKSADLPWTWDDDA